MTYRDLQAQLAKMDDANLDRDVTVYDGDCDEFFQVDCFETDWTDGADNVADGVLDEGHAYLIF